MLHTKFRGNRLVGSEKIFYHKEVCGGHLGHLLPYIGMVAILVM